MNLAPQERHINRLDASDDQKPISKPMKIDGQNMPPRRGLDLFGLGFYKDVTPTAFGLVRSCCVGMMRGRVRKCFFNHGWTQINKDKSLCY
jgi:hypothetical protein